MNEDQQALLDRLIRGEVFPRDLDLERLRSLRGVCHPLNPWRRLVEAEIDRRIPPEGTAPMTHREELMQDESEDENASHSRRLQGAIANLFMERGCSVTSGPRNAYFTTVKAGGAEQVRYEYRVLAQGGWKDHGATRGDGCETYDDLEAVMLALLRNWTKPDFPIIVRDGQIAEKNPQTGKWYGYFRFVQLDFVAEQILVVWDIQPIDSAPDVLRK